MNIIQRISKLLSANLSNLIDRAEDPELRIKQLIREMEGSIVELRRETVRAVARERKLHKQVTASQELVAELEEKAQKALQSKDEERARRVISRKLHTQRTQETMQQEIEDAHQSATTLKEQLLRLEDHVQLARRKKDELVRRKRVAETQRSAQRSAEAFAAATGAVAALTESGRALDAYEDDVVESEILAEAERDLLDLDIEKELELQKLAEESAVEDELRKLRKGLKKS